MTNHSELYTSPLLDASAVSLSDLWMLPRRRPGMPFVRSLYGGKPPRLVNDLLPGSKTFSKMRRDFALG